MGALDVLDYNCTFKKRDRDNEVQDAARVGIESARKLLQILTRQQPAAVEDDCDAMAGAAISKFQKVVSLLSRTGHARFRRGKQSPTASYVFYESANLPQTDEFKGKTIAPLSSSPGPYLSRSLSKPLASTPLQQQQSLQQVLLYRPALFFHLFVSSGGFSSSLRPTLRCQYHSDWSYKGDVITCLVSGPSSNLTSCFLVTTSRNVHRRTLLAAILRKRRSIDLSHFQIHLAYAHVCCGASWKWLYMFNQSRPLILIQLFLSSLLLSIWWWA